jgi:hypothetical protein
MLLSIMKRRAQQAMDTSGSSVLNLMISNVEGRNSILPDTLPELSLFSTK